MQAGVGAEARGPVELPCVRVEHAGSVLVASCGREGSRGSVSCAVQRPGGTAKQTHLRQSAKEQLYTHCHAGSHLSRAIRV